MVEKGFFFKEGSLHASCMAFPEYFSENVCLKQMCR